MSDERLTGTVDLWFEFKGWGFITVPESDDPTKQYFVHSRRVRNLRRMGRYERVSFRVIPSPDPKKCDVAADVEVI